MSALSEMKLWTAWGTQLLNEWYPLQNTSLTAAGLIVLADVTTVARRTALTGTSSFLDVLILCPGLHKQQDATELHKGEYPACAAMTTGYVFRVENQATVFYLQQISKTQYLTTLSVSGPCSAGLFGFFYDFKSTGVVGTLCYFLAAAITTSAFFTSAVLRDWWGIGFFGVLVVARLLNVIGIRRRASPGWHGEPEPGVNGDLLVLLSQDRWVRMQGAVDDLKAVTSGSWLQDATFAESCAASFSNLLVYLDVIVAANASQVGQIMLLLVLLSSVALLGVANESIEVLQMHGRLIKREGRKKYARRLNMAEELIEEMGRRDWAVRMGMVQRPKGPAGLESHSENPVIM